MIAQFVACFDTRSGSEFLANQNAEHNAPKKKKMHYENPRNSESAISEPRSGRGITVLLKPLLTSTLDRRVCLYSHK